MNTSYARLMNHLPFHSHLLFLPKGSILTWGFIHCTTWDLWDWTFWSSFWLEIIIDWTPLKLHWSSTNTRQGTRPPILSNHSLSQHHIASRRHNAKRFLGFVWVNQWKNLHYVIMCLIEVVMRYANPVYNKMPCRISNLTGNAYVESLIR